ncbi:Nre family DNA repair protein [Thermogladius sp.]|uniref:Nre family DNA repair protein n=1 Tax=Thermogladius sp. TaxID=2023064 RepID=UPI003D0BE602
MSRAHTYPSNLCVLCRGRGWCGLSYCPILVKQYVSFKLSSLVTKREVFGSSPPSVFVGRVGYPVVRVGLSVPPETGDTAIYDYPEQWVGLDLNTILDYRLTLVLGFRLNKKTEVDHPVLGRIQEVALSTRPVDVELKLEKPPKTNILLDETNPPIGPRSPFESFRVDSNPKVPGVVDRLIADDVKASTAVIELYKSGLPVSYIQRALSIGVLGRRGSRVLVPTRWSITAVDSIISEKLVKEVKRFEPIDEFRVYEISIHDNLFIAILAPRKWGFEWMEAWWPGSTWNPLSSEVSVEGDYELYRGRDEYPSIGGCYYASRLATAEHLYKLRRQAMAVLLREIYPGFNLAIGVWFVRESLRKAYDRGPVLTTSDVREVLAYLDKRTKLGAKRWLKSSKLLQTIVATEEITKFMSSRGA